MNDRAAAGCRPEPSVEPDLRPAEGKEALRRLKVLVAGM
jgi:hypothetical protein